MLALGLRKRNILGITLLQIFMLLFVSYLIALAAGIPLLKPISIFTEHAYKGSYTGVVFSVPWTDLFLLFLGFFIVVSVFQTLHMRQILRQDITALIHEQRTLVLAFSSRSGKRIEHTDKIKANRRIYEMRSIHSVIRSMVKTIVLFTLPLFLMILSISYNESRTFTDERTAWLSPADGRITETVAKQIQSLPSVEKIAKGEIYNDGSYMFLDIYSVPGAEQECADRVEEIANQYGLLSTNIYQAIYIRKNWH